MGSQLQTIALGNIHPGGWIMKQMEKDLHGFVGHLDQLAPELMIDDLIYGEHRLTTKIKGKSVGNIQPEDEWIIQYLWWNSESQSNWCDGYLRHSFLLVDKKHLQRINE